MCLPISYPEDRKDVGELEKLLRSDLPDAKRMYRRCTQEKRPSLSQEWPVVRGMDQEPVGLSAGVGAVVLLVQETHKEGHHLSHGETGGPKTLELKENGDPVGLSADVGIVVLLEDSELVGLSADVGIVVLPVSKLIEAHIQACPYTQPSLRRGISELPEDP
ncbi:hypothetical protein IGI04_018279 [Brassica rapa subsp. trilocularis]|uniref:Uncharacterized protein n=2 Tax=Brassica rapa subsp. trilocularis TaxID=1813537 RepID=A0ABQ7KII2_BRACM|nr:hypothetical protein IGI04_043103 [Brassica rapa subsp. trilocularis]KAG5373660.1 hypothetical protein IGI04_043020 [Brassica rapa subsp. trilocularis]KAG5373772.1 hypothetical protein IGI04_042913 [Brassica rapa subsp. trilocularis]KAG5373922.1 hypothetical protein IGI04_042757 [Brassica rapa subsp. trilocularis]KAG5373939.1 hypothetical protein IGI04_042744 [Brassica rapa subsp. trilocularis]